MNLDRVISWLLNSDWYLVAGWLIALCAAVALSFSDMRGVPRRRSSGELNVCHLDSTNADIDAALSFVRERSTRR